MRESYKMSAREKITKNDSIKKFKKNAELK